MTDWSEHSRFALALFALLTPFSVAPVFIGLTAHMPLRDRVATASIACIALFLVLGLVLHVGEALITALGTSLASFQIAGGAIIAMNGFVLMAGPEPVPADPARPQRAGPAPLQVAVVPLAIPMLAGPGAMTQMMLEGHGNGLLHEIILISITAACAFATWLILLAAIPVVRILGATGLQVFQRVFGLVLIAIGVEIAVRGVLTHAAQFAAALNPSG